VEEYCSSTNRNYKDVAIHFFVQYHLHLQLKEAVEHAHSKGVALKGDIPIGVSRNSVDVWQHPELFDCGGSAGAPPDYFSKTGQVWGFPIYNWEEMAKDDYQWWKKRLSVMSEYYDAYRIDHILGFFRIFRTPVSSHYGLLGQFTPALPMSIPEIEEYGLKFDKEYYTRPIINDDILAQLFGEEKEEVVSHYLDKVAENRYRLKEQYETQEKIDRALGGDEEKETIKKKLYHLCCQVLFVEDYKEKGKYHPRIALPQSYLFSTLSRDVQERLRKIYEDFHYHRHNDFWKGVALRKLEPLIDSTNMMVCGEDLGMVPHCVASVMEELQILSLEIQRMPKEEYVEFGNLMKVPYLSVCTTSTHDMSTMRQWWETEREGVCRYFSNELRQYGDAPQYCEPWVATQIVENHLKSPASWVILPLQDWMAVDGELRWSDTFKERINDPGDPNNYWRYRMHLRVEELISNDSFNDKIRHLIKMGVR
jgi:4-alpha-glucanotransferase